MDKNQAIQEKSFLASSKFSVLARTAKNRHPLFILEILEHVFDYLDEFELIVCSSVSMLWYDAVTLVFQKCEKSKRLYRWPYGFVPRSASELCIVGFQELDHVLSTCRGISRLHLSSSEPATISRGLVTNVFAKCTSLKELCFSNLKFEEEHVKELLSTAYDLRLEIISLHNDGSPLDRSTLRLLLDNRELFSEVLLINNRTKNATGWYPNPIDPVVFFIPSNIKRLHLDCFGLSGCHFARSLVALSLENASCLSENSLSLIARLPLKRFHISFFRASEKCWIQSLDRGFFKLNSLSVANCDNVTVSVLRKVAMKELVDLSVDIRASVCEYDGLRVLSRMTSLRHLSLTCAEILVDDAMRFLSTRFIQLKSLTVIKYEFIPSSTAPGLRRDCIDFWKRKKVKTKFILIYTNTKCLFK